MIDLEALCLTPALSTFAIDVIVTPIVSRPGHAPYKARGVFSSSPITVEMQDGTMFSDQQTTLDIKLREFKRLPGVGDKVKAVVTGVVYWIGDLHVDGQGGGTLTLRLQEPK